jgi:predicted dehydrogenase
MAEKRTRPAKDDYTVSKPTPDAAAAAPVLPYQPRDPKSYRPGIGLIGCGGIAEYHLKAYRQAGYNVVALCDLVAERARRRRDEFYPKAVICTDHRELLRREDVEVVDIATHPAERIALIEDSLRARKHVLSQKPFVLDLDVGERLTDLADRQGVKLAVNQNGRWAPHFSYIRCAVQSGLLGEVMSIHTGVHWDHTWTVGTVFEEIRDVVLYDFGIHWFDFMSSLLGSRPVVQVHASRGRAPGQIARPPMLAQAILELEDGQASLVFDAHVPFGPLDHTYVAGTMGTIRSDGPNLSEQTVTLTTAAGAAVPKLEGTWFSSGFHGTMAELLCAIEENREPLNNARDNLKSLALCFAAIAAATDGGPKSPLEVRRLPPGSAPGADIV